MARPKAVTIGVEDGLSAALARELSPDYSSTLAARSADKMQALIEEAGAQMVLLDATKGKAIFRKRRSKP